jgi:hypothetical protein
MAIVIPRIPLLASAYASVNNGILGMTISNVPLYCRHLYIYIIFTVTEVCFPCRCELVVPRGGAVLEVEAEIPEANEDDACKICDSWSSASSRHWLKDNWSQNNEILQNPCENSCNFQPLHLDSKLKGEWYICNCILIKVTKNFNNIENDIIASHDKLTNIKITSDDESIFDCYITPEDIWQWVYWHPFPLWCHMMSFAEAVYDDVFV